MLVAHAAFAAEAFGGEPSSTAGPVRTGKSKGKGAAGKLGPPVDRAWAERWRVQLKMAGRQFSRLVEMLQLLRIDAADVRAMRAYRLQVKERLYRFNFVRRPCPFFVVGLYTDGNTGGPHAAGEEGAAGEARGDVPERVRGLPADISDGEHMSAAELELLRVAEWCNSRGLAV